MTAAVQQGTHTAHPAAHSTWSCISDSLTHSPSQTAPVLPEWNRLYVASSLHLRPCHLLYEQHGTARLMFACDDYNLFKEKLIARIPKTSTLLGNIPLAHDG